MKKLSLVLAISLSLMASEANVATLTDIKEALYYLIKDYKALLNSSQVNYQELNRKIDDLSKKIEKSKNMDTEAKKYYVKNNILIKEEKKDKYDEIIDEFVRKNGNLIEK